MPATPAWLAAVEAVLNRGIFASMPAAAAARRLDGTALRVDIKGVISIRAGVAGGRLALLAIDTASESLGTERVDAIVAGSPFALLDLAGGSGRPTSSAGVQVSGNAEVANSYRELIALATPDLEEELSRIVGDLAARGLSQFVNRTLEWARGARRSAGRNIAEYLQEESRDLVNSTELEEFLSGVDVVRDSADRVEARVARLERLLNGGV